MSLLYNRAQARRQAEHAWRQAWRRIQDPPATDLVPECAGQHVVEWALLGGPWLWGQEAEAYGPVDALYAALGARTVPDYARHVRVRTRDGHCWTWQWQDSQQQWVYTGHAISAIGHKPRRRREAQNG